MVKVGSHLWAIALLRKENSEMLDEQTKRQVKELCDRIAHEQDPKRFTTLIAELNRLLGGTDASKKGHLPTP